jgi:hypothetical protein
MELIIVLVIVVLIVVYLVVQRKKDPVTDTTDGNLPVIEPSKEHATNLTVISVTEEKVVVTVPTVIPAYEPDDGPLTDKQIEQIKEVATTPVQSVAEPTVPKGKKGRKPRITSDPRDVNHDGVTSEEEKRAWTLADSRDTNHDGVISAEEKSVAKRTAKAARKPSSKKV